LAPRSLLASRLLRRLPTPAPSPARLWIAGRNWPRLPASKRGSPRFLVDPLALALSALTPEGRWPACVLSSSSVLASLHPIVGHLRFRVTRLISVRFRYKLGRALPAASAPGVATAAVRVASCFMDNYMAHSQFTRSTRLGLAHRMARMMAMRESRVQGLIREICEIRGSIPWLRLGRAGLLVHFRGYFIVFILRTPLLARIFHARHEMPMVWSADLQSASPSQWL